MIRDSLCNQTPEILRVVEFLQMTELMDYQIISELGRQANDPVVEIQIFPARTASPPCLCVLYENFLVLKIVELVEVRETRMHERSRSFTMFGCNLSCPYSAFLFSSKEKTY